MKGLSLENTRELFIGIARDMVENSDMLNQADRTVGDGDHGMAMSRGFQAALETLEGETFDSIGAVLKAVGNGLMMSAGGASGVVFGVFFLSGAKSLSEKRFFDSDALASLLSAGLQAVKERGKAEIGDKTVVDALEPAARVATECLENPLSEAAARVAQAAREGTERTKDMVARVGKAKTLGERSLGYADPGALSLSLMLESLERRVSELN